MGNLSAYRLVSWVFDELGSNRGNVRIIMLNAEPSLEKQGQLHHPSAGANGQVFRRPLCDGFWGV